MKIPVEWVETSPVYLELKMSDGSIVRVRPTVTDAYRLDEFDSMGQPKYEMVINFSARVNALPALLRSAQVSEEEN